MEEKKIVWRHLNFINCDVSNTGRVKRGNIIYSPFLQNGTKPRISIDKKKYFISVLVARAFPEICGEWFPGAEVHHKDCNPNNNLPNNLVVLTHEQHKQIHKILGKGKGKKNAFYGKKHSEKTKLLLKKKMSKPVFQFFQNNLVGIWSSCTEIERETGMDKSSINRCCLLKQNTSYGFTWRYLEDFDKHFVKLLRNQFLFENLNYACIYRYSQSLSGPRRRS